MEKKFEDAIAQLEVIVKQLETGNLTLDESMEKFKEGVDLAKLCNTKLQEAEKSITMLLENDNGDYVEEKFEV